MIRASSCSAAALGATGVACWMFLRPRLLDWGATPFLRRAPLPGDDLVPRTTHMSTRAITIDAPPRDVWPWLVQMGQDRTVWPWWQTPFRLLVFEPLHAYMQTGQLQGIKQRVERTVRAASHPR